MTISLKQRFARQGLKQLLRVTAKPILGSSLPRAWQRKSLEALGDLPPFSNAISKAVTFDSAQAARLSETEEVKDSIPLEVIKPLTRQDKVILYLHGGAYVVGSPATHRALTSHLAATTGCQVMVPDYRLAPEHPYPGALNDAVDCYQWLLAEGKRPDQILIAGDSAGGHLAVATTLKLRQMGIDLPAGLILFSPWTDPCDASLDRNDRIDPFISWPLLYSGSVDYLGAENTEKAQDNPLISLLKGDYSGFPPILIQFGTEEILNPGIVNFIQTLRSAKVKVTAHEYANLWHVFQLHAGMLDDADEALEEVARFIRQAI